MKKKEEKKTLAQQVDKLQDELRTYLAYYNPKSVDMWFENIETSFLKLEKDETNFIALKDEIEIEYKEIKKKVDNLDKIDELKQRAESLQAEIEKAYSIMTPDEIGKSKDVKIIPQNVIDEINSLKNEVDVGDIRQKASRVFEKYEIAKKQIDAKAKQQEQSEIESLEAKVKEEMFSKENSDKWGYVYRNDDGKITDLAPGTQKEVNLGNRYGICYEIEREPSKYCFCENRLQENKLTPEQEFAIQREKEARAQQLADYKENPDKYSETYIIPAIVKSPVILGNDYSRLKIDVHVTKGELIEAGFNPDRMELHKENISSKDIAESTKGIGAKFKSSLKRAFEKIKNISKDDKNNDDRDDLE